MRLKHFPLPISSSLKPFVLLISTLSSENRLREKFPPGYICIFARLAISREVKRATQQFKHFSGAEQRYLLSPALLRTVMEEQTRIPFLMNSENQGLLSPPLIHSSENIPPLYSFPFRATFPQFKLLLNSSFSSAPDYKLSSYPSDLALAVIVCMNVCLYYCCFQVTLPPPSTLCSISIYCLTPLPV